MSIKSYLLLSRATRSRPALASTGGTPATQWLGYTGKTRLRGFEMLSFSRFPRRRTRVCIVANYIRPKLKRHLLSKATGLWVAIIVGL